MYSEDELVPISALQHYAYCPRQCALIHIDQIWVENVYTAEGRQLHEKVDQGKGQAKGGVKIERDVSIRSLKLGLIGKADLVEFHRSESGRWLPYPVEYKRGRPKKDNIDAVQLCAQALCLEEMLSLSVYEGALFYGKNKRRKVVKFDTALRQETDQIITKLHGMFTRHEIYPAVHGEKCISCSLVDECLPHAGGKRHSVARYINKILREA